VHLARVAGVRVHEHELPDVVQQRGDEQAVPVRVGGRGREPVGRALDRDGVQPEALRRRVPSLAAFEELERRRVRGQGLHRLGRQHLDGVDDRLDLPAPRRVEPVREPQHRDHERDVGLDRAHDLPGRGLLFGDQLEQPVARLGERREHLERLERGREPLPVALVARPADHGVRLGRASSHRGNVFGNRR
jgi:hypothetical protein